MFLPMMTDEEKMAEALGIVREVRRIHKMNAELSRDKMKRATRFPFFIYYKLVDDRNNTWWLTYMCRSKEDRRKGRFLCYCYTIYEIEKKEKGIVKVDGNTGKGIFMFDPLTINELLDGDIYTRGMTCFIDIVPHAFNQYTKRYLKDKGRDNISFRKKVESIMLRWMHFDVIGDESSDKHADKGDVPYDVFMFGGGMLRGQCINAELIRFFTYIDESMMFEEQLERQKEMTREYYHWKAKGIYGK